MSYHPTTEEVRAAYAEASLRTHVSVETMMSESKDRNAVRARWLVMKVLRDRGASLPTIGRRMQLHHTTVLYGLRQCGRRG